MNGRRWLSLICSRSRVRIDQAWRTCRWLPRRPLPASHAGCGAPRAAHFTPTSQSPRSTRRPGMGDQPTSSRCPLFPGTPQREGGGRQARTPFPHDCASAAIVRRRTSSERCLPESLVRILRHPGCQPSPAPPCSVQPRSTDRHARRACGSAQGRRRWTGALAAAAPPPRLRLHRRSVERSFPEGSLPHAGTPGERGAGPLREGRSPPPAHRPGTRRRQAGIVAASHPHSCPPLRPCMRAFSATGAAPHLRRAHAQCMARPAPFAGSAAGCQGTSPPFGRFLLVARSAQRWHA